MIIKKKRSILQNIIYNTEEAKPYFTILGLVLIFSFFGFYLFNKILAAPQNYENFMLRLIVIIFGFALTLYKYWPEFLIRKTPWIFYLILTYSFPFFFSYMLFKNADSNIWQINGLVGFVLLSFFVDWLTFVIMSIIAISAAYLLYYIDGNNFISSNLIAIYCSYSAPIIYFIIFSGKSRKLQEEKELYSQQIKNFNNQLEQKIQERTKELEKSLEAKTEFLNNMSHEIRTPIQGFAGISEGLVDHWSSFDDNKRLELAAKVAFNAKRLKNLVGNLLDLSKFSAGKMILNLTKMDLNEAVLAMIDECEQLYLTDKKISIIFEEYHGAQTIADAELIAQVLRNLFINAIKFSPNDSKILIKIFKETIIDDGVTKHDVLHFVITDFGIGIPEDELQEIFSPFSMSSRTKTKAGGTGLGLAIARKIIEANHGKIWAEHNPDGGAIFHFFLPLVKTIEQDSNNQIITEHKAFPTTEIVESRNSKKPTIMIIDDDDACLTSMELLLYSSNYQLIKASSGVMALDYLRANPNITQLILLDLMMPDMYGLTLLEELKKDRFLSKIPVIMQTGTSDEKELDKCYKLGAISHIAKPYEKKMLLETISKILSEN